MPLFVGSDLTCLRGHRLVFTGLSFGLDPGNALVLLGPNGSGKSSLLRVMAGLLKPYAGDLLWDGEVIADEPDRHRGRVSYVGHLDAVKPVLTARENLAFWAALAGADEPAERARFALERMGVAQIADVPGRFLSAGQKRRLNLARIVAVPQPLWLLDEPTVALDRAAVVLLESAIAEHRAGGGVVVVSTHAQLVIPDAGQLQIDHYSPDPGAGLREWMT
ncbi:MAG: heme ABC exporter ATP-binding protein CcmA [Azospirillaceae bacterium]|nr:heme ABC exporter ATP-binding protein CcmA [Azospirillaceae bacterium]